MARSCSTTGDDAGGVIIGPPSALSLATSVGDAHRYADIGRLMDGASLTPSPVIATIHRSLAVLRRAHLVLGDTRPNASVYDIFCSTVSSIFLNLAVSTWRPV
jgi:hypothetical protein